MLEPSADAIRVFVEAARCADGGFRGRSPESDLYYTAFGLECVAALGIDGEPVSRAADFLGQCDVAELDPIHLACAARAWARIGLAELPVSERDALLSRLSAFALEGGGYRVALTEPEASPYGCFLAHSIHQDLGVPPPDPAGLIESFATCRTPDGAYNNEADMEDGATPATAGVVLLQTQLPAGPDDGLLEWMLSRFLGGGFEVFPGAPVPDLLSTAIALFALNVAGIDPGPFRDGCREFIRALQRDDGGFCGHVFDDVADLEYTFYALLALGCLTQCGTRNAGR